MGRYGHLVEPSVEGYAQGGFPMDPRLATLAENGAEMVVPLEDRAMGQVARQTLGVDGIAASVNELAGHIDAVRDRIDYQTKITPSATGAAVKSGVRHNLRRDPATRRALMLGQDKEAMRANLVGR
jgi:hypothetical protein